MIDVCKAHSAVPDSESIPSVDGKIEGELLPQSLVHDLHRWEAATETFSGSLWNYKMIFMLQSFQVKQGQS